MVGQRLHSNRVLERLHSRSQRCRHNLEAGAGFSSGRPICVDRSPSLVALMFRFFNAARPTHQAPRLA